MREPTTSGCGRELICFKTVRKQEGARDWWLVTRFASHQPPASRYFFFPAFRAFFAGALFALALPLETGFAFFLAALAGLAGFFLAVAFGFAVAAAFGLAAVFGFAAFDALGAADRARTPPLERPPGSVSATMSGSLSRPPPRSLMS